MKLANNRASQNPGWCYASKQDLADDRAVTRQGLIKMINRLEDMGLLERHPKGYLRHTQKWYDAAVLNRENIVLESDVNKVDDVNNVYRQRKQSLQEGVNKVDIECKQSGRSKEQEKEKENLTRERKGEEALLSQKNENGFTAQPFSSEAEKNNTPPNSAAPPPPDLKVTVFDPPTTAIHTGPTGTVQVEDFKAPRVEILSAKSKKQTAAAQELQFAAEAIEYLNQKAGRSFRTNVASNAKGIIARYREGFSMEQVKKMVDHMCRKWGSDREMQDHLNPVTLFRDSNFERYYQSAEAAAKLGPSTQPSQNGNYHRMTYNAPAPGKEQDF